MTLAFPPPCGEGRLARSASGVGVSAPPRPMLALTPPPGSAFGRVRPPRKGEGKQAVAHGCANTPPVIGSFTPVVLGNVIGSPLRLRTAR